jgi:ribose 5-phosphate isomerase B
MNIVIGADHRGFTLKEALKKHLISTGFVVIDSGAHAFIEEDDAIDYAVEVVNRLKNPDDRGILMCGSGQAMVIGANRFSGVQAILGFNESVVEQGRRHDNANVLCLPAEHISVEYAIHLVQIFLDTTFSTLERYRRRQEKLKKIAP